MANENEEKIVNSEINDADFTFVQQDASIHDVKFETKPTTFLKDALRRFAKNKSSLVATGILAVLIGMAIIVPIADGNDIEHPDSTIRYLPPKWFPSAGGFLDGTGEVKNIVIDPLTGLPEEEAYRSSGIIKKDGRLFQEGDDPAEAITYSESYFDDLTETIQLYGKGGSIRLNFKPTLTGEDFLGLQDGGLVSPIVTFSDAETVAYRVSIADEYYEDVTFEGTELKAYLGFQIDNKVYPISETLSIAKDTKSLVSEDVVAELKKSADLSGHTSFNGRFAIMLSAPSEEKDLANSLLIEEIKATSSSASSDVSNANMIDATVSLTAMAKKTNPDENYALLGEVATNVYHSISTTGSFRYDYYTAAFGIYYLNVPQHEIDDYVARGWMKYVWSEHEGKGNTENLYTFEILDPVHCPIRAIYWQDYVNSDTGVSYKQAYCARSYYRYLYAQGRIGACEVPSYFFGTDKNGKDFFKLVFSGLLTSLALGALSASINIFIGLIWGSVSGYFGGWTDIIMERVTEILGGMPWIVMMTLIVLLLGSNFWTLLLALCLTGWIGISGVTRSQFYRYKGREYVLASRTLGASDARLIFKHILPNGIGTIVTSAVLMIPGVIFTEANIAYLLPGALAFSGANSFGVTMSNVQADLSVYPYLIVSASLVMALIMISFNLFGNGLRDAFNPSLKGEN